MIPKPIVSVTAVLLLCSAVGLLEAQSTVLPSFDVVSVKPNNSDDQARANFPLGPGDVYVTNGGYFTATGFPLATYVAFAYKIMGSDAQAVLAQLPGWASTERFDIQARTDGDPAKDTKDQMRLMMRSLLADRFKLTVHYETRDASVFALTLQKPDKMGPQLQAHPAGAECTTVLANGANSPPTGVPGGTVEGGYPTQCGGLLLLPSPNGRLRGGARNVTMPFIGNLLTNIGALGRPVVDHTGLSGTFDFVLEFSPDPSSLTQQLGPDFLPDPNGPSFMDAVKNQLGLKLESQKASAQFLMIDHVERPTGN